MSDEESYHLRLFVTGQGVLAKRAQENIQRICEHDLKGKVTVDVVDILTDPEQAEEAKILATPTLIKQLPEPLRRIIGDLTDRGVVLAALGLTGK